MIQDRLSGHMARQFEKIGPYAAMLAILLCCTSIQSRRMLAHR
jgi:uncharacterized OsmC-like protein